MRPIDAEKFCTFLRDVSTRQRYEELLCSKDKYPTVADVIEAICCELDGTGLEGYENAPTVEPQKVVTIPHELIEKLVLCMVDTVENIDWDKAIEAYRERPKGQWQGKEVTADYKVYGQCSVCLQRKRIDNFCPNCGADMRKDKGE